MTPSRTTAAIFLAGSALLALASSATAQVAAAKPEERETIVFRDDPKARERGIATTFFGVWLDGYKDGKLETSVADLNGDGTAEVFVKLRHASTCDTEMKSCRTIVIMHNGREWVSVVDRPTSALEMSKPGKSSMRSLLVNGYEVRSWNGNGYQVDLASLKTTSPKFSEVTGTKAVELARGFSNAAEKLTVAKRATVVATDIELGGRQGKVVKLEGESVCGIYLGCPLRVLVPDDTGRSVPVLETSTRSDSGGKPDFKMLTVTRGGWPSMVVTATDGTPLMAEWDGRRYNVEPRQENRK
jgi:hypothetical protein